MHDTLDVHTGDPCPDLADAVCDLRNSCTKGASITNVHGLLAPWGIRLKLGCAVSGGTSGICTLPSATACP